MYICLYKELYILTGMETFAKEPKFEKLLREIKFNARAVLIKKPLVLSYVCNRKCDAFGCFSAG